MQDNVEGDTICVEFTVKWRGAMHGVGLVLASGLSIVPNRSFFIANLPQSQIYELDVDLRLGGWEFGL